MTDTHSTAPHPPGRSRASEPPEDTAPAAAAPPWTGRRALAVVGLLAALVAVFLAVRWWTHPTVFGGWGNGVATRQGPGGYTAANVPFTTPLRHDETLTLRSAVPVVTSNTAGAVITVHVCDTKTRGDFFLANGTLTKSCDRVRPVAGATLNTKNQAVVVSATPTKAGTVRIAGLNLSYARSWPHLGQRGTERVGVEMVVHAR